ncbi:hypothetical protein K474DRAFT_897321, partial [Panus rudis PR-1116 ss-1]
MAHTTDNLLQMSLPGTPAPETPTPHATPHATGAQVPSAYFGNGPALQPQAYSPSSQPQPAPQPHPAYQFANAPSANRPSWPAIPNPMNEHERLLYESVVTLAQTAENTYRAQHTLAQGLEQLTQQMTNLSTRSGSTPSSDRPGNPRVREPFMFDGRAKNVVAWVRDVRASVELQRRGLVTDADQVLYASMYLKQGDPIFWYDSLVRSHDSSLSTLETFLSAF